MLVLSRRENETLLIGPDVKVTVVRIDKRRVLLAIDAPREVVILRDEVKRREEGEGK